MNILIMFLIIIYSVCSVSIFFFSLIQLDLFLNYKKSKTKAKDIILTKFENLPFVTVQLPIYNEQNVNNKLFECKNKSLNGLGLVDHENIGADFLEKMGFPKSITSLGRNHVLAKRYLITNTPDYLENLSEASKETFKMQGGILSSSEKQSFEDIEGNDIFIRMRHWDDMAKNTNFKYLNGINYYEKMALETLIRA